MKVAIILGTRPEIIKLSSFIRSCKENKIEYFIIHTNQHYSQNMDEIFFKELKISTPKYNLEVGSGNHGKQTGRMLERIESILEKENPSVVIVQGDTNSVLAGSLAATKMHIPVAHIEAGLRSGDLKMPEEKNRIVADVISDFLFCPTELQKKTLLSEGTDERKIFVVGNTISDAVLWAADNETEILDKLNLKKEEFLLLTLHRAENVDDKEKLQELLDQIGKLKVLNKKIIFPVHPRTKKQLEKFELSLPDFFEILEPVGFLDLITLQKNANVILTDSGGLQEESCILNVPCITLRTTTERPESIQAGGNKLAGEDLLEDYREMTSKQKNWKNPFGNGDTAKRILDILREKFENEE
jgi:UDP-N-acetylglucosamine 2-epimerase (non-hydrolysing)